MKFYIKKRDTTARIGEITIKNKKIKTPNIFFLDTKNIKAPEIADIVITQKKQNTQKPTIRINDFLIYPKALINNIYEEEIKKQKEKKKNYYILSGKIDLIDKEIKDNKSNLLIIGNANQLYKKPKEFINYIVTIKEKIGTEKNLYLPAIAEPNNLSILTYLGIDFFDSIKAITAARNKIFLFQTNNIDIEDLNEIPCSCPSCIKIKNPKKIENKSILNHNYYMLKNEINHIRNSINNSKLRNLVESRVNNNPHLTTLLREYDKNNYKYIEKNTPVNSKSKIIATTKESFNRAEIKRFQNRVIKRYKKPESSKILLVLPCSAKKPYSFSKSHNLFKKKIFYSGNQCIFHELIITSPIGLVPRELELVYPASNYDIPVTGLWDEDEKKMIRELLISYLKNNKYEHIITHLPKNLNDFVKNIFENPVNTCIDHPTSNKSLELLEKTLKEYGKKYKKINSQKRKIDDFKSFASYQFGRKIANDLIKNSNVKGKYPYQKLFSEKSQLGMIIKERGMISLTLKGAERLIEHKKYWVEIFNDFNLIGSVFSPGIKNADEDIRLGDEVIVLQNKKLKGVGVAMMNGENMKKSSYGEAVKIRHLH